MTRIREEHECADCRDMFNIKEEMKQWCTGMLLCKNCYNKRLFNCHATFLQDSKLDEISEVFDRLTLERIMIINKLMQEKITEMVLSK